MANEIEKRWSVARSTKELFRFRPLSAKTRCRYCLYLDHVPVSATIVDLY